MLTQSTLFGPGIQFSSESQQMLLLSVPIFLSDNSSFDSVAKCT